MLPNETQLDPRVRRTRALLQQAFFELMSEQGFQATTVQDITSRATVNRATFYAHYEDKYDLLDNMIREKIQADLMEAMPEDPDFSWLNLELLILTVCGHMGEFHGHQCASGRDQLAPLMEREVQAQIYEIVLKWLEQEGVTDHNEDPRTAASILSWAIFGAGMRWSRSQENITAEAMAARTTALLRDGLAAIVNLPVAGPAIR